LNSGQIAWYIGIFETLTVFAASAIAFSIFGMLLRFSISSALNVCEHLIWCGISAARVSSNSVRSYGHCGEVFVFKQAIDNLSIDLACVKIFRRLYDKPSSAIS
jgi:hypothetical protein